MENSTNIVYTASCCVRKNKEGKVMMTKEQVKDFATIETIQTKVGERFVYHFQAPRELPKCAKDLIFDDFYPVALSAFNQNKSETFEKDVYDHLFNVDGLILIFHDEVQYGNSASIEKGIAFRTYSWLGGDTMYVEGTAVDPNYQGMGFYQGFTKISICPECKYVVSRTQNPVVLTALERVFGNVSPITRIPDEKDLEIANKLADKLNMTIDENCVGRETYGRALNGMLPKISNDIQFRLYQKINPMKGDCVIAVCRC